MKTFDVKFNGKDYKVRSNFKSKLLYEKELKKNPDMGHVESIAVFAWCMLRGFNKGFDMSFDDFAMYIDDPDNEDFIKKCTEAVASESDEEEKGDSEKK